MHFAETTLDFDINKDLPGWGNRGPVTKDTLTEYLTELWHKNPEEYARVVSNLKLKGDYLATYQGNSVTMKDIEPAYNLKKAVKGLSPEEYTKKRKELEKLVLEEAKKKDTSFSKMIISKARGNASQLMQLTLSPGYYANAQDEVIPVLVDRSFSEGLTSGQYFASSFGARKGVVFPQLATASSGALSKELLGNTSHYVVTMLDCGTQRGIQVPTDSENALDRYLAHAHGKFPRNTLVTPEVQKELIKSGFKVVEIRSPLTCMAHKGVCSYCLGPVGEKLLPEIGFNAGVTSSHALGEKITQLMLSCKHTGGLAGSSTPVAMVEQMLHVPEKFQNKATLAEIPGKVTGIKKLETGAHLVYINDKEHYVPPTTTLTVKVGSTVEKGEPVSEGYINPKEYATLKGLNAAKKLFADTLYSIFKNSGHDVHKKHFEVIASSLMDTVRITGGHPEEYGFLKDDLVSLESLKDSLLENSKVVPKEKAIGKFAATQYGDALLPSQEIKKEHLKYLPPEVAVIDKPVEYEPDIQSLVRTHLYKSDWMTGLARSYLKDVILTAAEEGKKAKLGFIDTPINNYVMGKS